MKNLFLLIVITLSTSIVYAQTPYADGTRVTADSITYAVENVHGVYYRLVNIDNKHTDKTPIDLNGNPISPDDFEYKMGVLDVESLRQAITATFSHDELAALGATKSGIRLFFTINNLGELLEIVFQVYVIPTVCDISITKFELFEKNLKKYLRFPELSEFEKNLQFSHSSILIRWERYAPKMLIEKDPNTEILPDSVQALE